MKRNAAIEIYRVLLMLGIVTLHTLCYIGQGRSVLARLCAFCVVGFVFISGYFGVDLSWRRLLRLYGVAGFCAAWNGICDVIVSRNVSLFLTTVIEDLKVWWFVNSYAFLVLMAPMVNRALESCSSRKEMLRIVLPIIGLIFGWSFVASIPCIGGYIPADRGFGTHVGICLVGIYVAARAYRLMKLEWLLPAWGWVLLSVSSGLACACNLGKYNSPFALVFAASLFTLFKRIGESKAYRYLAALGEVCVFLSPSMLSVYLLHVGGVVRFANYRLDTCEAYEAGLSCVLIIVSVFISCVVIDLGRRGIISLFGNVLRAGR